MSRVISFSQFESSLNEANELHNSNECLCPEIWSKSDSGNWSLDGSVSRKLLKVAHEFFRSFAENLGDRGIKDIQLTGDLSNFNYKGSPDLDVHILVDLSGFDEQELENLKREISRLKFNWDINNHEKIRGYNIDTHLHDIEKPHTDSGLYSILNNKWIKHPPKGYGLDEKDVEKKFMSLAHAIDSIDSKIGLENTSDSFKEHLFSAAYLLKKKIQRMRSTANLESKLTSVAGETFKKLKNEGYIDKLVRVLSILPNDDN